jgi:hypothetical protein
LATIVTVGLFAAPAAAATVEEAVVPPSNSAATQYTETFPTSGGDTKTDQRSGHHSPAKVLGSHNAKKLEKQGPEGRAAAELAAATAPSSTATVKPTQPPAGQGGSGGGPGGGQSGGGGEAGGTPNGGAGGGGDETAHPAAPEPAGSSGLGETLGQATGFSSTPQSSALLPLAILATVLWSLAYLWRQRRRVD